MAVEDIIKYISENQMAHSVEDLTHNLRQSGYPESEIAQAIASLQIGRSTAIETNSVLWWLAGFFGEGLASWLIGTALTIFMYSGLYYNGSGLFSMTLRLLNLLIITAGYYYYIKTLNKDSLRRGYLFALVINYIVTIPSLLFYY